MKDYFKVCEERIRKLVDLVLYPMDNDLRSKIITIITIDVHGKDIVDQYIHQKIADSGSFEWQKQLKFFWIEENSEIT